jgi:hypothetical protein
MWPQYGVGAPIAPFPGALYQPTLGRCCRAAEGGKNCRFPLSTGRIFPAKALTIAAPEDYIHPLGAPPLGAMARLRSPSLFTR